MKVNGVLLCVSAHEMAHNNQLFLNLKQCIGDVNSYIAEYSKYFTPEVKYKIWTYMQMCEKNESFDNGVLDMEVVKNYIKP